MRDLGAFGDESFDLIVHPVSNLFVPDLAPVWREAHRVLRPGAPMLTGFTNPDLYLFDDEEAERTGILQVKYALPYSDLESISDEKRAAYIDHDEPLEFSHTLEEQIGAQLAAGFRLTALFQDTWSEPDAHPVAPYMPTFFATRAVRR